MVNNKIEPPPPEFKQVTKTKKTDVKVEHEVSHEAQREAKVTKEVEAEAKTTFDFPKNDDIPVHPILAHFPQRLRKLVKNS